MDPLHVAIMIAVMVAIACLIVSLAPDPLRPPPPPGVDDDGDWDYYGPEDLGDYQAGGRP